MTGRTPVISGIMIYSSLVCNLVSRFKTAEAPNSAHSSAAAHHLTNPFILNAAERGQQKSIPYLNNNMFVCINSNKLNALATNSLYLPPSFNKNQSTTKRACNKHVDLCMVIIFNMLDGLVWVPDAVVAKVKYVKVIYTCSHSVTQW